MTRSPNLSEPDSTASLEALALLRQRLRDTSSDVDVRHAVAVLERAITRPRRSSISELEREVDRLDTQVEAIRARRALVRQSSC